MIQDRGQGVQVEVSTTYQGHSYPTLLDNRLAQWLWARLFCPRGWHMWDEVVSSEPAHYLYCDACEIVFGEFGA